MSTGVFFHETFMGKEWLIRGDKFRNIPVVVKNVLVFTVAADHHAERDFAWGATYASFAGPAF
jgi:hypothetical protein